jgi:2-polyprenyl-3-methyl-5-hydroxy-6-metoxy-1,4-benzoquinol methylase
MTIYSKRMLYQPLPIEKINNNSIIIRKCEDRFESMLNFSIKNFKENFKNTTLLDVGSSYGYFMEKFSNFCYSVEGIDNDSSAIRMSKMFYPKIADNIKNIDADLFFKSNLKKYDIVLCLSLVHHFIYANVNIDPIEFLKNLDEITEKVLFFEMAQDHEKWFDQPLEGWNEEYISNWVLENTTFDFCQPLSKDNDSVGMFEKNYGRTLFACYRKELKTNE